MCRVLIVLTVAVSGLAVAAPITELKPLYPQTEIAIGGQAKAALVAPDEPELAQLARGLAARLAEIGGVAPEVLQADAVVSASWEMDFAAIGERNLIALGSISSNRLLAVLWGEGYACSDSIFPGENGYVVRTVHDPFANGINVVVLGASDPGGLQRAVDVFCEKYVPQGKGDIVLPEPITDIEFTNTETRFYPAVEHWLSSKRQPQHSTMEYFQKRFQDSGLMDAEGNVLRKDEGNLVTVLGAIGRVAQTYFWNGNEDLRPLMKELLDKNRHLLKVVPRRVEMEASAAGVMQWWDIAEELPVWTDQDRLEITNAFLSDSLQGHEKRRAHEMVKEGFIQVVDQNHGTNSALNTFRAWNYFEKYYDLPETEYWMSVARAIFAGQCASHQILEDAAGYLCYCPIHAMKYAFASRDIRFLELGIARGHAEYIAQCSVNNLGLSSGFGDASGLVMPGVFEAIAPAAWYYRDPRLSWVMQNMLPQACGLRTFQNAIPFDLSVEPQEPVEWTGMTLFPIFKQTLGGGEASKEFVSDPRESVGPQWFNKIVFRESWSPKDQYLLFDGAGRWGTVEREGYPCNGHRGPSGHKHDDVNTIINFTDQGRMWLVDHTYGAARGIKDHSGLYITRDGQVGYRVHEARLLDFAQDGDLALCRSVFEGFSGADWERTIFWKRGEHFTVIDRAIAREPGHYVVRCSYRGIGEHELRGPAVRLAQEGKFCDIVSDGRASLDVEEFVFPSEEEWTKWYEHAAPVAKVFQQDKVASLEPGEAICFTNLIQAASSEAELDAVKLVPVSETSAVVESDDGETLYGVGSLPGGGELGSYAISPTSAVLAGLIRLGPADKPVVVSSVPVSLHFKAGEPVQVEAAEPVTITLADGKRTLDLPSGNSKLDEADLADALTSLLKSSITSAREQAVAYHAGGAEEERQAFGLETLQVNLGTGVADMMAADLDGDGPAEWIVVGDEGATALKPDGTRLWQFATEQPCRALDVGDLDGDGKLEVAAGCDDEKLHMLSSDGSARWSFECKASTASLALAPAVDFVKIADLDVDGNPEVVVGANWVHCLDASGQVKWEEYLRFSRGRICGDFKDGAIADFDADGDLEVLALFRDSYHKAVIYDPAGNVEVPLDYDKDHRYGVNTDLARSVLTTNLYGREDGLHFIVGGDNRIYTYWGYGSFAGQSGGRKSGCFPALACYRPEGQYPIVFGATDMGAVIAYQVSEPRNDQWITLDTPWSQVIGERISALWAEDVTGDGGGELVVGAKSGAVHVLDALTGEVLGRTQATGSPIVSILAGEGCVLAVHADGIVETIGVTE